MTQIQSMHDGSRAQVPPSSPGVYALTLNNSQPRNLVVGRGGAARQLLFASGWYACVGSAHGQGGLRARTNRHIRLQKSCHWMVDYVRPHMSLTEIWYSHLGSEAEHEWAQRLSRLADAEHPIPGFAASDCREGCPSHLLFFGESRPHLGAFVDEVGSDALVYRTPVEDVGAR